MVIIFWIEKMWNCKYEEININSKLSMAFKAL